jgi:hypothetical protein
MKTIKLLSLSLVATLLFSACSDDDDAPEVINEEELITTVNVYLTAQGSTEQLAFSYTDLDADGVDPEVTTSNLSAGTTYSGRVEFLNELESPAEDITEEVVEEAEEHQVFYTVANSLDLTVTYDDEDANGNPLGVDFTLTTGVASQGNLTITLIHEGDKDAEGASAGDLSSAVGGETDIELTFDATIE